MKNGKKKKKLSNEQAQQRKFRARTTVYEIINIVTFVSIIIFVGLCLIFLKRPTVSESEKRELAKCPKFTFESYTDGSFASGFTEFFSDTVPYRETIVQLAASINKMKGISAPTFYGNVNVVADDEGNSVETDTAAPVTEETAPVTEAASPENTPADDEPVQTAPPVSEENTVTTTVTTEESEVENIADFSNNGIVVDGVKMYGDNAGVMLFGGSKTCGTRYAELISKYKTALGDGVNVYNMVVPTSVEFYLPKKFQRYSSSEKDSIDHIYSSYTADVIPVDAYSEIAAHTDEYIYLRTDHHWSQRGAYYAYKAFAQLLGQTPPDIDKDYEVNTKEGFVGSLYTYTNDPILKNSPEIFTYYKPKTEYTTYYYAYDTLELKSTGSMFYEAASGSNCYGMYIGGDAIHSKTVTALDTGRKICVFKESYGNAFVPFLADSFDEIYVIDIRYFGRNAVDYIKENGITDVLFINNAFAANTNSLIDGIEKLYNNPYGTLDAMPEGMTETSAAETSAPSETETPEETAAPSETDPENTAPEEFGE
ncbi:MAG: DHHW family protein [Huintestinicola sp.]